MSVCKMVGIDKGNVLKVRNLSHSDNWKTPPELYNELDSEFGFDFDPCPYVEIAPPVQGGQASLFTVKYDDELPFDGLSVEWGKINFVNPPYSRKLKEAFVKKAIEESKKGKTCVMLLPVSTSTALFHEHILPNKKEIRFIRGRVRFHGYNTKGEWSTKENGMHDSMIVVF